MPIAEVNGFGNVRNIPERFTPNYEIVDLNEGLGSREEIIEELMDIVASVRTFHHLQPDEVMMRVSAYDARLTELAMRLQRVEDGDRQYMRLRTQQVERLQKSLEVQFKVFSRIVEITRQDLETSR